MSKRANDVQRTLIFGGEVLSCNGEATPQEAIVVDGGRIAAVGTLDDLKALAGESAKTINVGGATILPGFVDTHPHAMHFGTSELSMVDLSDAQDHDDIIQRVQQRAANTPEGQWIMCTPVGEDIPKYTNCDIEWTVAEVRSVD